jgi:hypothetical protein
MSLLREIREPLPLERPWRKALIAYAVRLLWFFLVVMIGWFVLGVAVWLLSLPSDSRVPAVIAVGGALLLSPVSTLVVRYARRWGESADTTRRRPT